MLEALARAGGTLDRATLHASAPGVPVRSRNYSIRRLVDLGLIAPVPGRRDEYRLGATGPSGVGA